MLTAVRKLVDAAAKNVQITKPVVTLESAPATAKKKNWERNNATSESACARSSE